ncbi:MAG: gene transfer agent family protein [Pseudomonadota bacterium]
MANPWRSEVALEIDGTSYPAKLTLGALVELETLLKFSSLQDFVQDFEEQKFSAKDVAAVLFVAAKAGGWQGDFEALLSAKIPGGPMAATQKAVALLVAAFSLPGDGEV